MVCISGLAWNVVLHFSFSSFMNIFMSCRLSLPSQFLITGTLSLSVRLHAFVSSMFVTSFSKLSKSVYLSRTFQLNEGSPEVSPPCLCHCGSLWLPVMAGLGSTSASLNAIITAVTTRVPAWLTTS